MTDHLRTSSMAVILKIVDFDYLPIEYEQRVSTKVTIDCLTNNRVEKLKVSLIEQLFDNVIYESNPQNVDFDDLPFNDDES